MRLKLFLSRLRNMHVEFTNITNSSTSLRKNHDHTSTTTKIAAMPAADIAPAKREMLVVTVDKPIPLEFDMGHLTAFDNNPLDAALYATAREECISAAIRDGAQALINQVLTALPLKSTKDGIFAELPDGVTPLPREKPIPRPKELTKWFVSLLLSPVR